MLIALLFLLLVLVVVFAVLSFAVHHLFLVDKYRLASGAAPTAGEGLNGPNKTRWAAWRRDMRVGSAASAFGLSTVGRPHQW